MILRKLTLAALRSSNILISLNSSWFVKVFFFFRSSIFFILLANLLITGLLPAFRDGSLCAIDISFSDIWASSALLMSTIFFYCCFRLLLPVICFFEPENFHIIPAVVIL